MSTLKEKSKMNIDAALVLTKEEDTCLASVHCAYYSCYQLYTYFLETKSGLNSYDRAKQYNDYVKGIRDAGGNKVLGSHEYWLRQILENFKSKKHNDAFFIYQNLMKLKQARANADYSSTIDYYKKDTDQFYDLALDTRKRIIKAYES